MAKWLDHYDRWGINHTSEEQLHLFKYRMKSYLDVKNFQLTHSEAQLLNFLVGRTVITNYSSNLFSTALDKAESFRDYVTIVQTAFEILDRSKDAEKSQELYEVVDTCLSYSPLVGLELVKVDTSVVLYPKGAKLLDEAVINQTLVWLEPHPKVLKPFEEALELYMSGDKGKQRNLLDNLRFSVEQLLKEISQNSKPIEKQSGDLKAWLKVKDAHPQIVNLYGQLLFGPYTIYQNDVKHTGSYKEQDVEFMIYLTGTFMRQLLNLQIAASEIDPSRNND